MDTGSYDYLKYCAARYVWPRRKRLTPSSQRERQKRFTEWHRVKTWQQWWEHKFNDQYLDYVHRTGQQEEMHEGLRIRFARRRAG